MENERLLGVKDLMTLLGVGKPKVMQILTTPGCPTWPRNGKNSPWLVPYGEFTRWYKKQIERG